LLFGKKDAKSPYQALFYYRRRQLQAVRMGDWKYHLPLANTHPNWTTPKTTGKGRKGKLVNLHDDLRETTDVADKHPDVVKKINRLVAEMTARLGNNAKQGSEQRLARTLDTSSPLVPGK
jgi:arylsulfatase A